MKKLLLLLLTLFVSCSSDGGSNSDDVLDEPISTCIIAEDYVTIGNQVWALNNVDVSNYCDGTVIPQIDAGNGSSEWRNLKTGAWTYAKNCNCGAGYTFSDKELHSFGKLYNWYAVMGIHDEDPNTPNKKLAPDGWRIPSMQDFELLFENNDNQSLRAAGTTNDGSGLWFFRNTHTTATNSTGFTALPAGFKNASGSGNDNGGHGNTGYYAYFWTSDVDTNDNAGLSIISQLPEPDDFETHYWNKNNGFSLRLIKE